DDPQYPCRPMDRDRDGFLIGEGAAALILESRAHAEQRGSSAIASVSAAGIMSDPTGITQIDEQGTAVAALLDQTLAYAPPRAVDYINVHATGTISNDRAEALGISQSRWLRHSDQPDPFVSGFKGAIGHLLGGAGSVEAALTLHSLHSGQLMPTTGLHHPDPAFRIRLLSQGTAVDHPVHRAVKLSLGFGGHLACVVLDAASG
ncbi:MAG: hypothetical protein KDA85_00810, partial [Planctomycetaceae bacterium]|nr:hypothetical protein [Planctomycetaceae bacterium]